MRYLLIIISILLFSCTGNSDNTKSVNTENTKTTPIITEDYQLYPAQDQKAVLVVFPCFPCDAQNTFDEFNIVDISIKNDISVLLMNYNMHLYMSTQEKTDVANLISEALNVNNISAENLYVGGFSGGGNVALLVSNYLVESQNPMQPKGVFIVDAPIDLVQLYEVAQSNISENFSAVSIQEASWIIDQFDSEFGSPDSFMNNYILNSPYITSIHSLHNISAIKDLKLRFYTEPDTTWWWENRHVKPNQMNAYAIENLASDLKQNEAKNVEYIPTQNKGYRTNGDRHPHSWSIVDKENLMKWILD